MLLKSSLLRVSEELERQFLPAKKKILGDAAVELK